MKKRVLYKKVPDKLFAFTLAEVLVTLTIVGVVAALTIPTLSMKTNKQELQTQFMKAYGDLNRASLMFKTQEYMTVYEYNMENDTNYSDKTLQRYLKYFLGRNQESLSYTKKQLNGTTTTQNPCDRSNYYADSSGRIFSMDDAVVRYPGINYGPKVCVDINGKKKPNRFGYDIFVFAFTKSGNVIPYTGSDWANLSTPATSASAAANYCKYDSGVLGHTCGAFALLNRNPQGEGDYWNDFLK